MRSSSIFALIIIVMMTSRSCATRRKNSKKLRNQHSIPDHKKTHKKVFKQTIHPNNRTYGKIELSIDDDLKSKQIFYGVYGAHSPEYTVKATSLVLLSDKNDGKKPTTHFGCTAYYSNSDQLLRLKQLGRAWVGVVDRGKCYYYHKARFAFEIGASALIVRSHEDNLTVMNTVGTHIPVILIMKTPGEKVFKEIKQFGFDRINTTISVVSREEVRRAKNTKAVSLSTANRPILHFHALFCTALLIFIVS